MQDTTYDVRVYKTDVYKGKKVTTYYVRWKTGDKRWKEPFRKAAQADSFRSSLMTAARKGEAFSLSTGRPLSWEREESTLSWYALTLDYTAAKWPYASPNHRRGIAEALTDATEVMLTRDASFTRAEIRHALRTWAFSERLRGATEPPDDIRPVLRWLETTTARVAELVHPESGTIRTRALLDRISKKQDGMPAAASTATRKRMTINNLIQYAIEVNVLPSNPLHKVKWSRPRTLRSVDPRAVINSDQARRLLTAVRAHSERGQRMVAFFGCMYYAALRPEEAVDLRRENLVSLPDHGWGEMLLTHAEPRSGSSWTNNGLARERRELKHRAPGETRPVPIHPELVTLLLQHIKEYGTSSTGRVFIGPRGGILTDRAYLAIFHAARKAAFTPQEAESLLARRPYDLRHAAVSTWLNAGVAPPQVAEWAGHSVDVLLRVYAKCIAGQQDEAKRRILMATRPRSLPGSLSSEPDEDYRRVPKRFDGDAPS
ncbi:MAG: tyrosine-type recombinase/integrase [Actinoallomurus sp.]